MKKNEILKMVQASLIIISPFSKYFPSPNEKDNNVPGYFNGETWVVLFFKMQKKPLRTCTIVQFFRFLALLVARCWTKLNQLLVDEGVF